MALIEPVPFPWEIDWSDRFSEEREYESTIQPMWDDSEQRSCLSEEGFPNRRFSYTIKALERDSDEFQRLQAALYSGQHLLWWAPYWTRERFVTAPASVGAVAVAVASTTHMGFVVGQGALLYRNPSRYEVVEVTAVNPTGIGVTATTLSWQARDKVVPCFRALMAPESEIVTLDVDLAQARVTFDLDIHED